MATFITSFSSFLSYGRLGSKLYNIRLPALISTILNILDTVKKCEGILYSVCASVLWDGCICVWRTFRCVYCIGSYVYWTVHHLDSWIKIDQLDVTCFIIHYLLINMFRMSTAIFRNLRIIVDFFHVLYWYPYGGWSTSASACIRIPHHPSRTTP